MATEDDILKTLVRIENALKASSAVGGGATAATGAATARRQAANQSNQQKNNGRGGGPVYQATTSQLKGLGDASGNLNKTFTSLNRTVASSRANFIGMNRAMRANTRIQQQPVAAPPQVQPLNPATLSGWLGQMFGGKGGRNVQAPSAATIGGGGSGAVPVRDLLNFGKGLGGAGLALGIFVNQLKGAALQIGQDYLALAARGIQPTAKGLANMYLDAARAGVSFEDWKKTLDESQPALLRLNSFAEFGERIRQTNDQLAGLGIFGKQATELSAKMMTATTTLGVPQEQLQSSIEAQIKTFAQLRKTSLLTADGFQKIVESLAQNQEVQSQLLGLSGQERSARFNELQQIQTLGIAMGGTEAQSKALGDAILAQRKMSTQDRFKAAGGARQAAAVLGINASDADAFAQARLAKNPNAEQAEILARVGAQIEQGLQQRMNSGNIQDVYIAEQMRDRLGPGDLTQAAGNIKLTTESGPLKLTQGADKIGQAANTFTTAVGNFATTVGGFAKNPLGEALISAISGAAFALGLQKAIGFAFEPALKLFGFGRTGATAATAVTGAGQATGGAAAAAANAAKGATQVATAAQGVTTAATGATSTISRALGMFSKVVKGTPLIGGIISAITEMFTGDIAEALNPEGGLFNRIGGVITAFFSAIPNMIFGVAEFIFGPEALKPIQNGFDTFVAFMNMAVKDFLARMVGGVADLLSFLPKDSGLVKTLSGWREGLMDSAAQNALTVEKLMDNTSLTLKDVAADNEATAKKADDASKKTTASSKGIANSFQASAGILTSTQGIAAAAISTAAQLATPGDTPRPTVTPPAVNTPDPATVAAQAVAAANTNTPAPGAQTPIELLNTQFAQMLLILQQSLDAEKMQVQLAETMVRASGAPIFADTFKLMDSVTGTRSYS